MKFPFNQPILKVSLLFCGLFFLLLSSCENKDEDPQPADPMETGAKTDFTMYSIATGLSIGNVSFRELDDNSTKVVITLSGLDPSASHPAHIHSNSAAEGGGIVISLENVNGSTGKSETIVENKDDNTPISYDEIIQFDGYVNVHLSASDLGTLVAQGDIGPNELTANTEDYDLMAVSGSGIEGKVTFTERASGDILVVLSLENTQVGAEHPAHIHAGSVVSGGGIAISLNPVNGDNGISKTDISKFDDDTPISYSQLKEYEGYVNIHLSASELGTIISTGDIGGNMFTGEMMEYPLESAAIEGISGSVTFHERESGKTLVEIMLQNTLDGGSHPSHIHVNSVAEGGGVVVPLNNVDGDTGIGQTDVFQDKDQNPLSYSDLIEYDGHVMVHLSSNEISTIIARGDIGGNMLTGNQMIYDLSELNASGINGSITIAERKSGFSLATIRLDGTADDGDYPAHIHENDITTGGGIVIDLENVDGDTGMSQTHIEKNNADASITYANLIDFNGHVKVHLSPDNLGAVVAGGDIGSNATGGARVSYANDIRPILDANCQIAPCHGTNSGLPSWATYENVSANADNIKSKTSAKIMPPSSSGKSLTDVQIQLIANWVDDGAENN